MDKTMKIEGYFAIVKIGIFFCAYYDKLKCLITSRFNLVEAEPRAVKAD